MRDINEYFTIGDILDRTYGGIEKLKELSDDELKRLVNLLSGFEHIFDNISGLGILEHIYKLQGEDSAASRLLKELADRRIYEYMMESMHILCNRTTIESPVVYFGDGAYYCFNMNER